MNRCWGRPVLAQTRCGIPGLQHWYQTLIGLIFGSAACTIERMLISCNLRRSSPRDAAGRANQCACPARLRTNGENIPAGAKTQACHNTQSATCSTQTLVSVKRKTNSS